MVMLKAPSLLSSLLAKASECNKPLWFRCRVLSPRLQSPLSDKHDENLLTSYHLRCTYYVPGITLGNSHHYPHFTNKEPETKEVNSSKMTASKWPSGVLVKEENSVTQAESPFRVR